MGGAILGALSPTPGARIGVYEILGSLGAGGMGEADRRTLYAALAETDADVVLLTGLLR